ncbi:MAG TPA: EamA family transporter [Pseudolysinimonas sp.]|jgi:DME family drug/metabolite transporter|nr:EamA family transporter [Pseudolysinimonas sp.]
MPLSGVLALVLASLLWGTTGTTASFLPPDVSPLAIGASTMGVGGVLLFTASARPAIGVLRDRGARRWVLIGALGVFTYPLAFYAGMDLAGVAVGNVVALGSGPVFAALIEWLVERRRLDARWAVSTALAVLGIALLASGTEPDAVAGRQGIVSGVALALVAGLAYALYTYASGRAVRPGAHPSRGVMGAMFGAGAVLLLPVLLVTGAPLLQSAQTIGIAAYLAIGPMFVAYLLFGIGLRGIASSTVTTITLLEPVVATVLAVVVVGERLAPIGWAGLVLVLAGLTVLVSARRGSNLAERL